MSPSSRVVHVYTIALTAPLIIYEDGSPILRFEATRSIRSDIPIVQISGDITATDDCMLVCDDGVVIVPRVLTSPETTK